MNKLVELIVRLLNAILKIFKGNKPALTLPHPEEKSDYTLTVDSINVENLMNEWLATYDVPAEYHSYWKEHCHIIVSKQYPFPAATSAQTQTIYIRPEWANPGVIAHEICHIIWDELPETAKNTFEDDLYNARKSDPLITLAWDTIPYMKTNDIEAHAECYRYVGQAIPDSMKTYYPKLF